MSTSRETDMSTRQLRDITDPDELAFELGTWLLGLKSFAGTCGEIFADDNKAKTETGNRSREFWITHAALLNCSNLNFKLRRSLDGRDMGTNVSDDELDDLSFVLRDLIVLNESMSGAGQLSFAEWNAWNETLDTRLNTFSVAAKLRSFALNGGRGHLPESLHRLFDRDSVGFSDRSDLDQILPRVGVILRLLTVVERMLRNDEPLKPTLLIFAAVYDQTQQLINHINNRLARFPDEGAALFNSLDGASYSASLELKKVFQQELRGIVGIVPAPSVYARVETAYSLLMDSFQQILIDLARIIEPKATAFDFFPRFQVKLDQSLILRDQLWSVLKSVQGAEQRPEKNEIEGLRKELSGFLNVAIRYLHYKDEETVERFGEEVLAARDKKDLVPILHRFGAYLETLFGQINMRAVLAPHPFEETK